MNMDCPSAVGSDSEFDYVVVQLDLETASFAREATI